MKTMIAYAMSWLGVPYVYGGNSRNGIDCSGFVQKVLASAWMDPPADQTAQALYDHFAKNEHHASAGGVTQEAPIGALVFFGDSARDISHVAIVCARGRMIESGGGNKESGDAAWSRHEGHEVRIRAYLSRHDYLGWIMPRYLPFVEF